MRADASDRRSARPPRVTVDRIEKAGAPVKSRIALLEPHQRLPGKRNRAYFRKPPYDFFRNEPLVAQRY